MAINQNKNIQQITVPGLTVQKNIISYGDSFICAKNISAMSISPIPAKSLWIIGILIAFAGLVTLFDDNAFLGIVMLLGGALWAFIGIKSNQERGINLAVSLNSGNTLYFHCDNKKFLDKVLQALITCINNTDTASCYINFEKCTIQNSDILNDATIKI